VTRADSIAAIEKSLRRRFRVVETCVQVGGQTLSIVHPASAEDLISEVDFDRDERLPYWAELWPSSRTLAEFIRPLAGDRRSLLELGCGAGLVATSAALAGFDVVASDYYDDACRFARVNATRNGGGSIRGRLLDWRALPSSLERFDVVVASDVLYERPYAALVAHTIARSLADDGVAFVADPGRVGREDFLARLGGEGLAVRRRRAMPFVEGTVRQTITIFEIAR
jgi:predicted nicotinamide N-methyase